MKISWRRLGVASIAATVGMISAFAGGVAHAAGPEIKLDMKAVSNSTVSPTFIDVGDTASFTFTVTNTGDVALSEVNIKIVDPYLASGAKPHIDCPRTAMDAGTSMECHAEYQFLKADAERGHTYIVFVATGVAPGGQQVESPQAPPFFVLPGGKDGSDFHVTNNVSDLLNAAGDTVTYTAVVNNDYNQDWADVKIHVGDRAFPCTAKLAPHAKVTCTATVTYSAADLAAGKITVDVWGGYWLTDTKLPDVFTKQEITTSVTRFNMEAPTAPAVRIVGDAVDKEAANPGDTLTYTFSVQNSGNASLSGLALSTVKFAGQGTAPDLTKATCSQGGTAVTLGNVTLAFRELVTCKVTYKVVDADVTKGEVALQVRVAAKPAQGDALSLDGKPWTTKVTAKPVTKPSLTAPTGGASVGSAPAAAGLGVLAMLMGLMVTVLARRRQQVS